MRRFGSMAVIAAVTALVSASAVSATDPLADPGRSHAIHGTVFTRPWSVDALDRDDPRRSTVTMSCPLDGSGVPRFL